MNEPLILAVMNQSTMRLDSLGVKLYGYCPIYGNWAMDALKQGRDARWWLSARLLFGLTEEEADIIANHGKLL